MQEFFFSRNCFVIVIVTLKTHIFECVLTTSMSKQRGFPKFSVSLERVSLPNPRVRTNFVAVPLESPHPVSARISKPTMSPASRLSSLYIGGRGRTSTASGQPFRYCKCCGVRPGKCSCEAALLGSGSSVP